MYQKLNVEQKNVVDTVMQSVHDYCANQAHTERLYFMEGPAGTGKTFTYQVLCEMLAAQQKEVLCIAFTGVAAALLPNGRTAHAALGLPVPLTKDSVSMLHPMSEQ